MYNRSISAPTQPVERPLITRSSDVSSAQHSAMGHVIEEDCPCVSNSVATIYIQINIHYRICLYIVQCGAVPCPDRQTKHSTAL